MSDRFGSNRGEPAWWREVDGTAWRALIAGGAGWMLDAMDVLLFTFALGDIKKDFGLTDAGAGALMSATLVASACGGVISGALADRFGRVRMLTVSILFYSVFTAMTATAHSVSELVVWRVLVGLGLGAEWSAGSVLIAETWPACHRGKAIGLMQSGWAVGYLLATALQLAVLPHLGWRWLFAIGIAPALLLVWIRRNIPEPEVWSRGAATRAHFSQTLGVLGRRPLLGRALAATALTTTLLFAYWGFVTWLPQYLARPLDKGGAGMGIVKSAAWLVPMQVGAFFGYSAFGFIADRIGRRVTFIAFVLGAAALVPVYGYSGRNPAVLMAIGPLVGFFGHGYFSVFGAMLAELFPSGVRATAQGLCYNFGRGVSALAPAVIGALAEDGIGRALALTSVLYIAGAGLVMLLPETRGKEIE